MGSLSGYITLSSPLHVEALGAFLCGRPFHSLFSAYRQPQIQRCFSLSCLVGDSFLNNISPSSAHYMFLEFLIQVWVGVNPSFCLWVYLDYPPKWV